MLTDEAVGALAIGCPGHTFFGLLNLPLFTDASVTRLAARCSGLTTVRLGASSGDRITDVSVMALAEGCHGLTSLNLLTYGVCLSHAIMLALATHCPLLDEVDFCYEQWDLRASPEGLNGLNPLSCAHSEYSPPTRAKPPVVLQALKILSHFIPLTKQ